MLHVRERVAALQNRLKTLNLDAYVVPSADAHQSEYVADAWRRREFISGFTGSAGLFACTRNEAGVWTDSRYWTQAEGELSGTSLSLFRQGAQGVPDWKEWLTKSLAKGSRVALNPWLFSIEQFKSLEIVAKRYGLEIAMPDEDLIDHIWGQERPVAPSGHLRIHSLKHAGETVEAKLTRLRAELAGRKVDGILLSALDEVAWLFNLRGADVEYNPVFYSYALITRHKATLFVDAQKMTPEVREFLGATVSWAPYDGVAAEIRSLSKGATLWLDTKSTSYAVYQEAIRADLVPYTETSVIPSWKAAKNPVELDGIRKAHVRDGVAMVRFLNWLKHEISKGTVDEISAADALEAYRAQGEHFRGLSFATIAGFGPHGALPHYRSVPESNVKLSLPGIFLLDSGGQYEDGTTDITRTIALGAPTDRQREVYTRVLKGHLQLARAVFPEGTVGFQLDVLAREPIWKGALDYGHGTGHGVGAALCVHEGPFSISQRYVNIPLVSGNVLSNEPACYFEGDFGVRIENLLTVVPYKESQFGRYLCFENLTLCPYDRHLIDLKMMTSEECHQVDLYHQQVQQTLAPYLKGSDLQYLNEACAPL